MNFCDNTHLRHINFLQNITMPVINLNNYYNTILHYFIKFSKHKILIEFITLGIYRVYFVKLIWSRMGVKFLSIREFGYQSNFFSTYLNILSEFLKNKSQSRVTVIMESVKISMNRT